MEKLAKLGWQKLIIIAGAGYRARNYIWCDL